jgi:hypothetical protein
MLPWLVLGGGVAAAVVWFFVSKRRREQAEGEMSSMLAASQARGTGVGYGLPATPEAIKAAGAERYSMRKGVTPGVEICVDNVTGRNAPLSKCKPSLGSLGVGGLGNLGSLG